MRTDKELKDTLMEVIREEGGITLVLHQLCAICQEMAEDQRDIHQHAHRAQAWAQLAKLLDRAEDKSLGTLEV
jgi:hypothetical protein